MSGKTERENVLRLLKELESAGEIVRDDRGRYVLPSELRLVRGTLQGNERGFAFLVREEEKICSFRTVLCTALCTGIPSCAALSAATAGTRRKCTAFCAAECRT